MKSPQIVFNSLVEDNQTAFWATVSGTDRFTPNETSKTTRQQSRQPGEVPPPAVKTPGFLGPSLLRRAALKTLNYQNEEKCEPCI
jgi:hypothetical protein